MHYVFFFKSKVAISNGVLVFRTPALQDLMNAALVSPGLRRPAAASLTLISQDLVSDIISSVVTPCDPGICFFTKNI